MKDITCRERFIHWQNATSIFKNLSVPVTENRDHHEFSDVAMRNEPLLCLDVAVTSDSPLRTGKMWQKTNWRSVAKPGLCCSSPAGEAHRPSYCQHWVSQRNSTLEILPLNPKVPHDTPMTGKNNSSQPEIDTQLPWWYFKGGKKKWHCRNHFSVKKKKKKLLGQILETIFSSVGSLRLIWKSYTSNKKMFRHTKC